VTVNPVAFYVISAGVLGGAAAVVTLRNIVHAAVALVACLFMVGALYLAIGADFLAAAQILIYAGAIPVLIIFGIMLTRGSMTPQGSGFVRIWPLALLVSAGLAALLIGTAAVSSDSWYTAVYPQDLLDNGVTRTLGRVLLTSFALPFEVASVLLLAALVGAVTLARRDERELQLEEAQRQRREREERVRRRREERERARARTALVAPSQEGEVP